MPAGDVKLGQIKIQFPQKHLACKKSALTKLNHISKILIGHSDDRGDH